MFFDNVFSLLNFLN